MGREIRTVFLTGNSLRHRYAAACLDGGTHLVGVLHEAKRPAAPPQALRVAEDAAVIEEHLRGLRRQEERFFGGYTEFPDTAVREAPHNGANSPEVFEWVKGLAPDVVVLFGTGVIKPPLLTHFEGRIVNVHLGLSPYYRGTATNFWPLVNREPEAVGATIHLAVARVDAGGLLAQVRPEPDREDDCHTLGMKTIASVWKELPRVLDAFVGGDVTPEEQVLGQGKTYRRDAFTADAVRQMWGHFATGMMDEYLESRHERQTRFPIKELPRHAGTR